MDAPISPYVVAPPAVAAVPVADETGLFPVRRILCVGRNYAAHRREMGGDDRDPPFFFAKPADALVLPGQDVAYPPRTENLHHEMELVVALKDGGVSFVTARDLATARKAMENTSFDLILLDVNLPDGNGLDFLKELRGSSSVPVILLTANDMEADVVSGLELGADDYITKPFSLMILRARVNARLRSANPVPSGQIRIDGFAFSFEKMEFSKNGLPVQLSKTEQKLLRILLENRGNTLARAQLIDLIWTDGAEYVDENALSVAVKRLRDKLEDSPSAPKYIKTVYGIGYTWAVK
jgi:DNA-binding response OmpR family regulator